MVGGKTLDLGNLKGLDMPKPPKGGGKRRDPVPRVMINIRARVEWRAWLAGLAEFCRSRPPDIIDQALVEFAERKGYTKKAPKR